MYRPESKIEFKWIYTIVLCAFAVIQYLLFVFTNDLGMSPGRVLRTMLSYTAWISLPYFLSGRRFRWSSILWTGFWTVVLTVNSFYKPNFDDIATLRTILSPSGLNSFVIEGAIDTLSWKQPAVFAPWPALCAFYLIFRRQICRTPFSIQNKLVGTTACIAIIAGAQALGIRSFYRTEYGKELPGGVGRIAGFYTYPISRTATKADRFGLIETYLLEIPSWFGTYSTLTDKELQNIHKMLGRQPEPVSCPTADNSDKNLIFIVVESLNSFVLDYPDAAPFLCSLLGDSTTTTATNMTTQVGTGRSADGQFIYNTGLLPLQDEVLFERYSEADYPSIAKALGNSYYSAECIGETKSLWNHYKTNESYGYNDIFDRTATGTDKYSYDRQIFSKASDLIKQSPEPFFLFVTTLTMHDPYDEMPSGALLPEGIACDARDRVYFERTLAFDSSLAEFIGGLKESGLYDRTIVVIAADHDARGRCLSPRFSDDGRIPLFILNSGFPAIKTTDRIYQADVYPTVLDVMGKTDSYYWKGFGTSLFRRNGEQGEKPCSISAEDWKISRDLIKSGYFVKDL